MSAKYSAGKRESQVSLLLYQRKKLSEGPTIVLVDVVGVGVLLSTSQKSALALLSSTFKKENIQFRA